MTISKIQGPITSSSLANTTDRTMVLTSAQVLGDLIVFVNTFDPAVTTSTVTDTTLGYTQEIWYCLSAKAAGASANTITVHYSATTGGYSLATVYTYRAT